MRLVVRRRGTDVTPGRVEVEVGLLRRLSESQTWLVVEDGRGIAIELDIGSARALVHALAADPDVADELGLATASG